jgi:rhodanese-related sulfurtransferase
MAQWLLGIGLVALAVFMVIRARSPQLNREELAALMERGGQVVDVRTPKEFESGHVAGARNIPVQDLDDRMSELSKDAPVILYCQSGMRSASAARLLRRSGFASVHDIGSMAAWPR